MNLQPDLAWSLFIVSECFILLYSVLGNLECWTCLSNMHKFDQLCLIFEDAALAQLNFHTILSFVFTNGPFNPTSGMEVCTKLRFLQACGAES